MTLHKLTLHKLTMWTVAALAVGLGATVTLRQTQRSSATNPLEPLTQVAAPVVGNTDDDEDDKSSSKKRSKKVDSEEEKVVYNKLNADESYVILRKGTERAFTGEYTSTKDPGTYICRRCNAALYRSDDKFESHCGWPSFDDEIKGAVKKRRETDGTGRIEIVCENCGGHLGHVFVGEGFTAKNTRHCVNSISMRFIPKGQELPKMIESPATKAKLAKAKAAEAGKDGVKDASKESADEKGSADAPKSNAAPSAKDAPKA